MFRHWAEAWCRVNIDSKTLATSVRLQHASSSYHEQLAKPFSTLGKRSSANQKRTSRDSERMDGRKTHRRSGRVVWHRNEFWLIQRHRRILPKSVHRWNRYSDWWNHFDERRWEWTREEWSWLKLHLETPLISIICNDSTNSITQQTDNNEFEEKKKQHTQKWPKDR